MQTDHITFGVGHQADETVFADGHLDLANLSAGSLGPLGLHRAVLTAEVDGHAVATGRHSILFYQGAGGAAGVHVTGEGPILHVLVTQIDELGLEHLFIERLGPLQVLYMDFEPDHWIVFHGLSPTARLVGEPVVVWGVWPSPRDERCQAGGAPASELCSGKHPLLPRAKGIG